MESFSNSNEMVFDCVLSNETLSNPYQWKANGVVFNEKISQTVSNRLDAVKVQTRADHKLESSNLQIATISNFDSNFLSAFQDSWRLSS